MLSKTDYETMDREHRLWAATCSSSYRTCFERLSGEKTQYINEEKRKSEQLLLKNPKYLLIGDANYPKNLYDMAWPPLILYYEGDLHLLNRPGVGIVGSRKATTYGQKITFELSSSLAKVGAVIVSGGARGVDTLSHQAALKVSGKTLCVLGCGLNVVYPYENQKLFEEIREEGLMLSEYPVDFKPQRWTFPMRNRIIAALSKEIVVTEAAQKSGSLHTATFGEELNRTIYAVPHPITSENGVGNHYLIEMGARILYDPGEFLAEYMENHISALRHRMEDLNLGQFSLNSEELCKIFGLSSCEDKTILMTLKEIYENLRP